MCASDILTDTCTATATCIRTVARHAMVLPGPQNSVAQDAACRDARPAAFADLMQNTWGQDRTKRTAWSMLRPRGGEGEVQEVVGRVSRALSKPCSRRAAGRGRHCRM